MTETLQRDDLLALLNRLGSEDDAEVLQAARQAHDRIVAAGASWEDLLVPEDSEDDAAEDSEEADEPEVAAADDEPPAGGGDGDAESLALIGELLARKDISQELREELEGYKADIAEGEFVAADRRYLRAVHQRLKK